MDIDAIAEAEQAENWMVAVRMSVRLGDADAILDRIAAWKVGPTPER